MRKLITGVALAALIALPSLASASSWVIDGSHSSVVFKVRHFFTKVAGNFDEISGEIEFDPEAPEKGSVSVTIPMSSLDTNNEKRDGHLMSPDFFDVEKNPNMTFKSTKFRQTDDGLKVDGMLNMRGVDKPVTLNVEFLGAGPGMGGPVAGFSITAKINRMDWGVSWNKALDHGGTVLSEDVDIQIDLEAGAKG